MDDLAIVRRYIERYQRLLQAETDAVKRQKIAELLREAEAAETYVLTMRSRPAPSGWARRMPIEKHPRACNAGHEGQAASRDRNEGQSVTEISLGEAIAAAAARNLS